jgi:hypothetical protein
MPQQSTASVTVTPAFSPPVITLDSETLYVRSLGVNQPSILGRGNLRFFPQPDIRWVVIAQRSEPLLILGNPLCMTRGSRCISANKTAPIRRGTRRRGGVADCGAGAASIVGHRLPQPRIARTLLGLPESVSARSERDWLRLGTERSGRTLPGGRSDRLPALSIRSDPPAGDSNHGGNHSGGSCGKKRPMLYQVKNVLAKQAPSTHEPEILDLGRVLKSY